MLPYAKRRKFSVSLLVPMHPLMLHCGSTHLSSRVRVMGNGMVRLKRDVFEQRGGMLFARERQC
jgi:hypothetical protein